MKRGRNQRRRQGVNPNRALDSNGPEVRIRGTANQIYDKYVALARDASSSGDRVKAENYSQHAEHYFRLIRSMQPVQQNPHQPQLGAGADQPALGDGEANRGDQRVEEARSNGADHQEGAAMEVENDRTAASAEDDERRSRRRRGRRPMKQPREDAADAAADGAAEDDSIIASN